MKDEFYELQRLGMRLVVLSQFIQMKQYKPTRVELAKWNREIEYVKEKLLNIQQNVNNHYLEGGK